MQRDKKNHPNDLFINPFALILYINEIVDSTNSLQTLQSFKSRKFIMTMQLDIKGAKANNDSTCSTIVLITLLVKDSIA
jgi:hypothetical protein